MLVSPFYPAGVTYLSPRSTCVFDHVLCGCCMYMCTWRLPLARALGVRIAAASPGSLRIEAAVGWTRGARSCLLLLSLHAGNSRRALGRVPTKFTLTFLTCVVQRAWRTLSQSSLYRLFCRACKESEAQIRPKC